MTMEKGELKDLYCRESQRLVGVTPSDDEVEKLYNDYLAGVEFTESENDIIFKKDDTGKLDITFKPHKSFPKSFPDLT